MNIKLFFINYAYNIQIMSKSRFELWSRNIARKDEMIDMLIEAYQSTSCHTPFFGVETCSNTSKVFHYPSSFNHIETTFWNISNSIFCGVLKGLNKHLTNLPWFDCVFQCRTCVCMFFEIYDKFTYYWYNSSW